MTGDPIETVADLYRESVDRYAEMKASLGDHVSLFLLDDFQRDGLDYARRVLFTDLGIDPDDESLQRIDPGRKVNTLDGGDPRETLTAEEQAFLEKNPDLTEEALDSLRTARPLSQPG